MENQEEKILRLSHFTVEKAVNSILWIDRSGTIHRANKMAVKKYGVPDDEWEKTSLFDLNPGLTKETFEKNWLSARHNPSFTYETTHVTRSGKKFPVEVSPNLIDFEGIEYTVNFVKDISDIKRSEEILRSIVEGTATTTGKEFFKSLSVHIARALKVNSVHIVTCIESNCTHVKALALFENGKILKNITYNVKNTPAEDLIHGKERYIPAGLNLEFPGENKWKSFLGVPITTTEGKISGYISVRHDEPMQCTPQDLDILKIFATRVGAESDRLKAITQVEMLKNKLQAENLYLRHEIKLSHNFEEIITHSKEYKKILEQVEQVASTDATVLILGETGTGKELLTRAIHSISKRKSRPLVKVNCATLPSSLIESELFGHEKGAFTGALDRKIGRFELANGGTLFLDEIGELPLELQSKLLRVLQEGEFERVGGSRTIKVDVRILAATNKNLAQAIEKGTFRSDLFYRLNVFPIYNPALRERKEDIPLLVHHFVKKFCAKTGKNIDKIPARVFEKLKKYHWPGNIRELENIIERGVIISKGRVLELGNWFQEKEGINHHKNIPTLKHLEKEHILKVLNLTSWKVSGKGGAAEILEIKPTTLESRMKKHHISRKNNIHDI